MRKPDRKYFAVTVCGVAISALLQFGILSAMKDRTPFEQTTILFYADVILVLVVDKLKNVLKNKK